MRSFLDKLKERFGSPTPTKNPLEQDTDETEFKRQQNRKLAQAQRNEILYELHQELARKRELKENLPSHNNMDDSSSSDSDTEPMPAVIPIDSTYKRLLALTKLGQKNNKSSDLENETDSSDDESDKDTPYSYQLNTPIFSLSCLSQKAILHSQKEVRNEGFKMLNNKLY